MVEKDDKALSEHDFLKEVVTLVRKEFYKVGGNNDSDNLIEELLIKGDLDETSSDDS